MQFLYLVLILILVSVLVLIKFINELKLRPQRKLTKTFQQTRIRIPETPLERRLQGRTKSRHQAFRNPRRSFPHARQNRRYFDQKLGPRRECL